MAELHSVTQLNESPALEQLPFIRNTANKKICADYFYLSPHFCGKYKTESPHLYKKQSMQFGNFNIQFGNRTLHHLQR